MFDVARDAIISGRHRVFRDRCITVTWPTLANPQGAIVAHGLSRGCRQDKRFRRSIPLNWLLSPPGSSGRFTARLFENSQPTIRPVQSAVRTRGGNIRPGGVRRRPGLFAVERRPRPHR